MTAIERTAYPRLTQRLSQKELEDNYTPTLQEIEFVNTQGRGAEPRLTRLVLLKTIQCVGYFPALETIPEPIINYLRPYLDLAKTKIAYDKPTSLYRHHQAIRAYLDIKSYRDGGKEIVTQAIHHAAKTLNDPVDLINVAIEQLIYNRCELPAYSSLNRIAVNIRAAVNQALYTSISSRLSSKDMTVLDQLPQLRDEASNTDFIVLKSVPGKPLLTEMRRLENRLRWLEGLLDTDNLLKGISLARIQNFSDEARSLETYDLRDIGRERRYTLLVCLIHQAKIQNRDHLVEIFLKRIRRVHKKAKEGLDAIREQQRQLAERLIQMMMGIANAAQQDITDEALGQVVRESFKEEGGSEIVFNTCQSLVAYHNDNTLPLLWGQYATHSRTVL